jgi:TrmH family RNA methyltransferase
MHDTRSLIIWPNLNAVCSPFLWRGTPAFTRLVCEQSCSTRLRTRAAFSNSCLLLFSSLFSASFALSVFQFSKTPVVTGFNGNATGFVPARLRFTTPVTLRLVFLSRRENNVGMRGKQEKSEAGRLWACDGPFNMTKTVPKFNVPKLQTAPIPSLHSPVDKPRLIYSRNNVHIRRIRELHNRAERDRTGKFFVTGMRFVIQAAQQGAHIESLIIAPQLLTSVPAQRLVRRLRQSGIACLEVPSEVLHSISLVDDPQGIGAVIRQRWETLPNVKPERELCWLAIDAVQSPGNLGTILRCCDAVGCAGVILLGKATDPYDPACVRASMGALFAQKFVRCTPEEFMAWKHRHSCLLVGTSPHAGDDYQKVTYPAPVVLFMGSERKGLPPEFQALCDRMVKIPMVGTSDSLNLAIATSVLLYEVFNQRRVK